MKPYTMQRKANGPLKVYLINGGEDVEISVPSACVIVAPDEARRLARALLKFADGASKPKRKGIRS